MGRIYLTAEVSEKTGAISLKNEKPVSRDYFLQFIAANPELRTELTAEGEMIVMPPAYSLSGHQNADLVTQLSYWAKKDGSGQSFDSSAGFDLPNRANRSPDASWVLKSRIAELTKAQRSEFLPLCPDFVAELRSKSDSVPKLRAKMAEYMGNGARLGWLIDPFKRTVHIYRPHQPVQLLEDPVEVFGDPELPGFILDLTSIFHPDF